MKYLRMPDGRFFEYPDDVPLDDAAAQAAKRFPKAFGEEVGGIKGMASRGIESLISSGQTAFEALTGSPEEAGKAGAARQKEMGEKYKDEIGLEQLKKAYEEGGLWGGAKEVVRQVPLAIAEQAPNIGATIAGGRAGAMLGAPLGPVGAIVGGLGGAALPSLIQQFGGNIERQVEAGKPVDTGTAFAGAVPQAGLDVVGNMIPFGRTLLGKAFGPAMEKALAKGATEASEKLAQESLKKSLAKGLGVGAIAEIPTEVAQQMIERAQAGLDLTSDDALAEYGNTAYQVGLLAPIGSVGRVVDRSAARQDLAQKKAAEARTAAEKAEQERLASPAYFDELAAQQAEFQAQIDNINARLASGKVKNPEKLQGKLEQAQNNLAEVQAKLAAHPLSPSAAAQAQAEQLAQLQAEETGIPAEFAQQQEEARLAAEEQAKQQRLAMGQGQQMSIPGAEPVVGPEARPDVATQRAELDNQTKSLSAELAKINARIEAQQKELAAAAAAGDTTKAVELMAQAEKDKTPAYKAEIEKQLKAAQAQAAELKKADPAEQLKALQKQFVKAGDEGNFEAIKILAPQIEALKQQVPAAPAAEAPQVQQSFFGKEGEPTLFAKQAVDRRVDEVLAGAQKDLRAQVKQEKAKPEQRQSEAFMKEQAEQPFETTAYPAFPPLDEQLGYPQKAPEPTGLGQRVLGRPSRAVSAEQANEDVAHALSYYTESMDELSGGYYLGGKNEKLAGPLNETMPTKEDIIAKAEEAKNNVIDAALLRADNIRLDKGLPRLDDTAAMELAGEINEIFVKHTSEGGMAPQMPGRIAQATNRYAKPSPAEVKRGRAVAQEEEAAGFALEPQTEAKLAEKVAAEEGAGKTNRIDTVSQRLQEALDTKPTGAVRSVLEEAKRVVDSDRAPKTLLDEAEAQALRIINGKTPQMRTLYDETVIAKEGKVTEEAQQHFPQFAQRGTIRGTSEKFQRFLASPRMTFKREEYIRARKAYAAMLEEIKSLMDVGYKKEYAALEKKLGVLVDKLKRGNDIEQETKELIALHLKENPDYKRAVRVAKKAQKEWNNTVEMLSGRYAEETKRAEELKAIETHWYNELDPEIKKKNPNRYPRNAFGLQEAYDDKLVSRAEYLKAKAAIEESDGIAEYLHEISSLQADARSAYDKAQNTVDRYLREATQAAEGSKFIKQLKAEMDKLPAKIAKQEAALKAFSARVPTAMEGQAAFVQERARREEALAKERAALRNAQRAKAVVEATVKEVKETALREKREAEKEAAKFTAMLPTITVRNVEERISAGDIRQLKKERTGVIKDMKRAEKGMQEHPNDKEFKSDYATAKDRLTQINRQLADWQRKGAQVRGQPVGATYYSKEVTQKEGISAETRAAIEREQRKEETESRKEAYAKRQQLLAEGRSTSVIGLRNEIEKLNARLAEKNEKGKNVVSGSARNMVRNKVISLDKKLAKLLEADKTLLRAAKYEKAPGNIIKPVAIVPPKEIKSSSIKQIEEEARAERAAEISEADVEDFGAMGDALMAAGLDVVPESDQFNFSEQTVSGVNFAEGKTSMNTSVGMKGALSGYFQNPAEFDKHVTVFQTVEEAKKDATGAKALSQASNPYRVQAFTDKDGHVYMIADAVVPGQELAVFLHEVGVHAGMERLIGAENMAILSSQINQWSKLSENTLEGSIARKAVERAEKSSSANKTEERIAYFVEEAVKAGVDPIAVQKTGSPFAQWFRTLIAAMKSALRKIGLARFEDLTAQNIVDLAYGAAKLKMTGRWHGTAADFRRFNHAFMGTGEGAQAFGWGTYLAERVGIAKGYWEKDVANRRREAFLDSANPDTNPHFRINGQEAASYISDRFNDLGLPEGGLEWNIGYLFRLAKENYKTPTAAVAKAEVVDWAQEAIDSHKSLMDEGVWPSDGYFLEEYEAAKKILADLKKLDTAAFELKVPVKPRDIVGSLMYIDTAIHDDEYLDYNLEMKSQPHALKLLKDGVPASLLKSVEKMKDDKIEDLTGRDIYSALESLAEQAGQKKADKFVSLSLDKIGIKGVKFFDSLSRTKPSLAKLQAELARMQAGLEADLAAAKNEQEREFARNSWQDMIDEKRDEISNFRPEPRTRNYVVFNDKNIVRVMSEMGAKQEEIKFSESVVDRMLKPSTGKFNSEFDAKYPGLATFGDKIVAKDKGILERITANAGGLRFAIQFVDRFAGLQRIATTMKDKLGGFQMMYWLRIYDQRNNLTAEAASVGVPVLREETRADGKKEFTIGRNENSSNLREIVQEVGKAIPDIGDANATMRMFSLYRMARRIKRLDSEGKDGLAIAMGRNLSPADRAEARKQFDAALKFGEGNVHFKAADEMYTRYTRALINFLAQSGAISRETANLLNKGGDYIGFYREKNGLIVDGEHNVTMGDLTTQPYLRELLGGDTAIVDFRTSSLQNTNLLISMALNNLATRNTAITLTQLGLAKASNKKAPAGDNVVKYKVHGEDWHIVVDPAEVQGQYGIPADLLVKGMRGVSTTLPAIVRLMQGPANLLRKGVTRMPTYAARQVIRDSLNAYIAGGVDGKPVWNSVKQIKALMDNTSDIGRRIHEQGIGGGQVFSGAPDDVKRLMTDIMSGTNSWATTMAWLDKLAVNADTATRAAAYKSFRDQGMSDMEASLSALEMTNFSKRGISPSMAHMATMIPFFNAQIQGLNALWQAMAKTGMASERLDLKNKLLKRGAMMMAMTTMYAAMMADDEGYKNASADKKLANWLFYLPGIDTPLAIPIPFEVGFVFKAVPEALMLAASKDGADREVVDSLAKMAIGSIPGGSSFFIPQAAKPAIEVLTGKNLYDFSITEGTVGDIESARLKKLEPGQRKLPGTTGVAAALGDFLNVSPVKIDHFIRGYGGGMGAFLASAVGTVPEVLSGAKAVPQPEKKLNEVALIGGLFVATDGRGLIDRAFNKMEDAFKAKETYDDMIEKGDYRQASEYAKRNATMINANTLAGQFRQKMGELAAERRAIVGAAGMSPAEKRRAIDEIRQREIYLSKQLNSIE